MAIDVSFAARRQALMLESLFRGRTTDLSPDLERQFSDFDFAETLPPQAIRHLFRHSEVHLNVCWRDLSDTQWDLEYAMPNGSVATPRLLPRLRAVQVWHAALGLANGASARYLPVELEGQLPCSQPSPGS